MFGDFVLKPFSYLSFVQITVFSDFVLKLSFVQITVFGDFTRSLFFLLFIVQIPMFGWKQGVPSVFQVKTIFMISKPGFCYFFLF